MVAGIAVGRFLIPYSTCRGEPYTDTRLRFIRSRTTVSLPLAIGAERDNPCSRSTVVVDSNRSIILPGNACMRLLPLLLACVLSIGASTASAQEPSRPSDVSFFETKVRPLLMAHCYSCHSQDAEKLKGDLRLDRLSSDFADDAG